MDLFSTKIAYAAASTNLDGFIANVDNMIVNPLISLLFGLAIIFFLYGVFEFIANQENEEKKTAGKSHMLWGIVGIVIMLGVWTILGIIVRSLGASGQIQIAPNSQNVNLQ